MGHRAACPGAAPSTTTTTVPPTTTTVPPTTTTVPPTTTTVPPTTTTTAPEEPGWTTLSTGPRGIAIDERTFAEPDGSQVTVARFLFNHVDYSLHVGSQDPPTGNTAIGVDSGPAISGAEQQYLLACFNGGFKMSSGAGGFEVGGQVLAPLSNGLASLVIDSAGVGRVGVWGQDLPPPGVQVVSVRQNLPPPRSRRAAQPPDRRRLLVGGHARGRGERRPQRPRPRLPG